MRRTLRRAALCWAAAQACVMMTRACCTKAAVMPSPGGPYCAAGMHTALCWRSMHKEGGCSKAMRAGRGP